MTRGAPVHLIAHRGASATWPEHTRAAYLQAVVDGADGLECDVRLTADGVAVCWHDATVDRTTDGTGSVLGMSLGELRRLDVLRGAVPTGLGALGEQVLTLTELVDLARGAGRPLTLAIELKHPVPYGWAAEVAVLDVLAQAGWADGRVGEVSISLMSFHPGSMRRLAASVDPRLLMPLLDVVDPVGLDDGVDVGLAERMLAESEAAVESGAVGGVGPSVAYLRAHPERVRRWIEAGREVRVWTVDAADDLATCLAAGVHEVTTNDPAGLRRLLVG